MLEMAAQKKCRIALSSDAQYVKMNWEEMTKLTLILDQMEFPEELIVNHSEASALDFVVQRKKIRAEIKNRLQQGG